MEEMKITLSLLLFYHSQRSYCLTSMTTDVNSAIFEKQTRPRSGSMLQIFCCYFFFPFFDPY